MRLLITSAAAAVLSTAAMAQDSADTLSEIIADIEAQGYAIEEVEREDGQLELELDVEDQAKSLSQIVADIEARGYEVGEVGREGGHVEVEISVGARDRGIEQDQARSLSEIVADIEAQGYEIGEVEREDGRIEVEARNRDGSEVELKVDPTTGEIVETED